MSDQRYGKLFAPHTDDAYFIVDDRIPDESASKLERLNRHLSEELVLRGNDGSNAGAFFRQVPSTNPKLNQAQKAHSVQPYGRCYKLIHAKKGDEGAFLMETTMPGTGGEKVSFWMKRRAMPDREEIAAAVASLPGESVTALRMKYRAKDRDELIARMPHQGRGGMIIDAKATFQSGNDFIDALPHHELSIVKEAMDDLLLAQQNSEIPDETSVSIVRAFLNDAKASAGFYPSNIHDAVNRAIKKWELQLEILGYDGEDSDPLQRFDPEPMEPKGWAMPRVVAEAMGSKEEWNALMISGFGPTRRELREYAAKLGEDIFPHNEFNADMPPTYNEVKAQMDKVIARWEERHEAWANRRDPARLWETMGGIVQNVTSSDAQDDNEEGVNDAWPSYDARPRPGIAHGPAAFMNPEEQYYTDVLQAASTPEDATLYCGDAGEFANSLPLIKRLSGDGDHILGGHPLCREIEDFMEAVRAPRDYVQMGALSFVEDVLTVVVPKSFPLQTETREGLNGPYVQLYFETDEGTAYVCYKDGKPEISPVMGHPNMRRLKVIYRTTHPGDAVTFKVKYFSTKFDRWFIPDWVKNHPLFLPYADLHIDDVPFELRFNTRPEYLAACLPGIKVKCIDYVEGSDFLEIVERPAKDVFPILCLFFNKLTEEYVDGPEGLEFLYVGSHDLFEAVWKELRSFQKNSLKKLVDHNYKFVETLVGQMEDAIRAVACDRSSAWEYVWENTDGEAVQLYPALFDSTSGLFWRTLRPLQGKNSEVELPEASDAMELLLAMGYKYVNFQKYPTFSIIKQMVEREFFRTNVTDMRRFTVDGRAHMVQPLYKVASPSPVLFSSGLLGDLRARLMMVLFGVEKGNVFNAGFSPSPEALSQTDGDIDAALRLHVMEMFPVSTWGYRFQSRAVRLFSNWGKSYRNNWNGPVGRKEFFGELLAEPRLHSAFKEPIDKEEGPLTKRERSLWDDFSLFYQRSLWKRKRASAAFRRLALNAQVPTLTMKLINVGLDSKLKKRIGAVKLQRIMTETRGQHGPATGILERLLS